MIVWNQKIKKSEDVINAVINELYKDAINTDGVIEVFNDGKEQGCLLKIYDKYNPKLDLCFWIYMPSDRKENNEMTVIVGRHSNCTEMNTWNDKNLKHHTFSDAVAREMHKQVRDFLLDTIKHDMNKTRNIISI